MFKETRRGGTSKRPPLVYINGRVCRCTPNVAVQRTTTSFASLLPVRTFRFIVNGSIACVVLEPVSRFITVTPQLLRNRVAE